MKKFILLFHIFVLSVYVYSQELPHQIANTGVYEFLDELASMQIIEINSAVKPYSRLYIANKLNEADRQRGFNSRQQKELDSTYRLYQGDKETGRNGVDAMA